MKSRRVGLHHFRRLDLYAMHPCAVEDEESWIDRSLTVATGTGSLDVVGLIEAWGTVHVHREGFRAQYARPATLLLTGTSRESDYGCLIETVATRYRAGVLEISGPLDLAEYCRERGLGMTLDTVERLTETRDHTDLRLTHRV